MVLQFQPPFQINPNAETHGERSLSNLNQTIGNIGNDWQEIGRQRREDARRKQLTDIQQAQEDRARQSFGPIDPSAWGGSSQPSPMGPQPSSSTPQGTMGPQSMSMPPGTGIDQGTGQPMSMANPQDQMPVDHTSHFQQWKQMGQPTTYDHPDYGGTGQGIGLRQNPIQQAQQGFDPQTYYRLNQPQREAYLAGTKESREGAFRDSEINKNNAQAEMFRSKGINGANGAGDKGTWHPNPYTGELEWYPTNRPNSAQPGGVSAPTANPGAPGGAPGGGQPRGQSSGGLPSGLLFKDREKILKEKPKATGAMQDTLREYDNMIAEANAIKNDPGLGSATGMTHFMSNVPGTGAKRASARLETLKAKTLLNVLASLKSLSANGSSGFGALSNVEGEQIRNSISSLDPKMSKADLQQSIDRFTKEMQQRKQTLQSTFKETYGDLPNSGGGGGGSNFDPDVIAYAQKHGISPEEAQKIKNQRTGGQ